VIAPFRATSRTAHSGHRLRFRDRLRLRLRRDCPEAGFGLGAYNGGRIDANRFRIAGSNACGVHLALDGEVDLHQGEVRDNPIGVCLQIDGYDSMRLEDDVAYEGNDTNLTATTLPVPEPSDVGGFSG
jgi:hypothetical protein